MLRLIKANKIELILIFIGCYLFVYTYIGSDWASHYSADPVGTAAIPRFYLILLVICSIFILLSKKKKLKKTVKDKEEKEIPSLNLSQTLIFFYLL